MSRMIRKQIYIQPEQDALLKARAKTLGVTEAELVRRGIDALMSSNDMLADERQKAWDRELEFMRSRIDPQAVQRPRNWTRQEICDDAIGLFDAD